MTGKIIFTPQPEDTHATTCPDLPDLDYLPAVNYARGTQWQCDECKRIHVLVEGAQYNETYRVWRHLTTRNTDGREN